VISLAAKGRRFSRETWTKHKGSQSELFRKPSIAESIRTLPKKVTLEPQLALVLKIMPLNFGARLTKINLICLSFSRRRVKPV
jgi:hypothetical protein